MLKNIASKKNVRFLKSVASKEKALTEWTGKVAAGQDQHVFSSADWQALDLIELYDIYSMLSVQYWIYSYKKINYPNVIARLNPIPSTMFKTAMLGKAVNPDCSALSIQSLEYTHQWLKNIEEVMPILKNHAFRQIMQATSRYVKYFFPVFKEHSLVIFFWNDYNYHEFLTYLKDNHKPMLGVYDTMFVGETTLVTIPYKKLLKYLQSLPGGK